MRTGDVSMLPTGIYRSGCGCHAVEKIRHSAVVPACPVCERLVEWSPQASEVVEPPTDSAVAQPQQQPPEQPQQRRRRKKSQVR